MNGRYRVEIVDEQTGERFPAVGFNEVSGEIVVFTADGLFICTKQGCVPLPGNGEERP